MFVIKRDGSVVEFDGYKIRRAIEKANTEVNVTLLIRLLISTSPQSAELLAQIQ